MHPRPLSLSRFPRIPNRRQLAALVVGILRRLVMISLRVSCQDLVVRPTTPNILNVDSSTADGVYGAGQDILINVTFG